MATVRDLLSRWNQCLIAYDSSKTNLEAQVRTLRESLHADSAPPSGGFLSKLKARVSQGVETLKAHKQIRDLNHEISDLESNVRTECIEYYNQLLRLALASDVNVDVKVECDRLSRSFGTFADLRQTLALAIRKAQAAADAQDDAFAVNDSASSWQANDHAEEAIQAIDRFANQLKGAIPGIPNETPGQLKDTLESIVALSKNALCFNLGGKGQWLNSETADAMRAAVRELQTLDQKIRIASAMMTARLVSLSQEAIATAGSVDDNFNEMHDALKPWLPTAGFIPNVGS